jgi:hypothetical protein
MHFNKYLKKSHALHKTGANPNAKAVFPFYGRGYLSLAVLGNKYEGGDIRIVSSLLAKGAKKGEFERMAARVTASS